jgi:hypothetical protein
MRLALANETSAQSESPLVAPPTVILGGAMSLGLANGTGANVMQAEAYLVLTAREHCCVCRNPGPHRGGAPAERSRRPFQLGAAPLRNHEQISDCWTQSPAWGHLLCNCR